MNEDTFNIETRKFLKKVGITSQREIEHAVLKAIKEGAITGTESLNLKMTLEVPEIGIQECIEGNIALE